MRSRSGNDFRDFGRLISAVLKTELLKGEIFPNKKSRIYGTSDLSDLLKLVSAPENPLPFVMDRQICLSITNGRGCESECGRGCRRGCYNMNYQGAHFRIHQEAHIRIWEGMRERMREQMREGMQEGML